MIIKLFEELGYDYKANDWTGKPSSIYIQIINHNKKIGFFPLYNSREIYSYGYTNCFFSNSSYCNYDNFKKVLNLLSKEIKKFNNKWNTHIDKIVFKQDYGNIKCFHKFLKEENGVYIYEI